MNNIGNSITLKGNYNYSSLKVAVAFNFIDNSRKVDTQSHFQSSLSVSKIDISSYHCNSIAYIIGYGSLWGNTLKESASVYQWIEFADTRLYPFVCQTTLSYLGISSFCSEDIEVGFVKLKACLKFLNDCLMENTFLVGDHITQADIACTAALVPAYQLVIDEKHQFEFVNTTRWFKTMINQPQFQKELKNDSQSKFVLCNVSILDKAMKPEVVLPNNNGKTKTAAQLKKDAKKKEKMDKFLAKKKKLAEESVKPKESKKATKINITTYDYHTPEGEKKKIDVPFPASYSPKYVESAWYSWWEKMGFFKPEYNIEDVHAPSTRPKFVVCLPPPNVTGSLHLGHALTNTIQDVLIRWHRMKGETTLWVPGTDHAGIATQVVVEKKLWKETKLSRHDIGREGFVDKVWEWKNQKGGWICHQLRKLGSSLDWSREFFTMNKNLSHAVKYSFVNLHDRGIIFRSNRLVNWSCALRSAISDIEVNKQELSGRTLLHVPGYSQKIEFGVLVSFAYQVVDEDIELVVATTRIETMLGDTAVAVHPKDPRYKNLHGKFVKHPFSQQLLPIICDEMVDMEFGTGAVKITPAHDPNDYECGKRHNLKFLTIFTDDGIITNTGTSFDGMKRFDGRSAILVALKEKGLYRDTVDNPMVVPICSRSKDVVEPLIKVQWFMNCKDAANKAVEAVKSGKLKLIPNIHLKTWYHWLENIRDWCISRQLWWGHRIPAYYVSITDDQNSNGNESDGYYWVSGITEEEAKLKASKRFNVESSKINLRQDEDVLDTWFSAGLLPFSIFGWPEETKDLNTFFPGALLETGHDIIFFWVARMVMFSIMLTGKLPFKEVYFHAMVRDAHGRKMSKSLGNVIDPLHVINGITLQELHDTLLVGNLDQKEIERAKSGQKQDYPDGIPECGSDALRFALCAYTCQGRDINLDVKRILGYRHFCNKIWNAFKFASKVLGEIYHPDTLNINQLSNPIDKWILSRLSKAVQSCNTGLETYDFPLYTTAIFNFWLYDLCDVYLEHLKSITNGSDQAAIECARHVLFNCVDVGLRLLHPLMPFITEELWQRLPKPKEQMLPSISVTEWPEISQYNWSDEIVENEVDAAMNVIKAARSLRAQYNLTKKKADLYVRCTDNGISKLTHFILNLSYSNSVNLLNAEQKPPAGCAVVIVNATCDIHMLLKGVVHVEKELYRLQANRQDLEKKLKVLQEKMNEHDYKVKAPTTVQNNDFHKTQELEAEISKLLDAEKDFQRLADD